MTAHPHDALFRSAFADPRDAEAELRHVLPPSLALAIDWTTIRPMPGSFVDPALRGRHTDLLFSAELAGEPALIYLLLEHQSSVDRHMPLRMLVYMTRIWERWLATTKGTLLPPIIPVVVAHDPSGRGGPASMHEIIHPIATANAGLAELVPAFRLIIDDIGVATDAQLHARALGAFPKLALWLLRDVRRGEVLLRRVHVWADALHAVARAPGGIEAMHRLMRYVELVMGERHRERFERFRVMLSEVSSRSREAVMLYSDEVRAEGRAEGIAQGKREVLLKQLTLKFGLLDEQVVARVRAADPVELERWLERVVTVMQLRAIFER